MKTKKIVSFITSVATVAATTGTAFLPLAAGAAFTTAPSFLEQIDTQGPFAAPAKRLTTNPSNTTGGSWAVMQSYTSGTGAAAGQWGVSAGNYLGSADLFANPEDMTWDDSFGGSYWFVDDGYAGWRGSSVNNAQQFTIQDTNQSGAALPEVYSHRVVADVTTGQLYVATGGNEAPGSAPPAVYVTKYDIASGNKLVNSKVPCAYFGADLYDIAMGTSHAYMLCSAGDVRIVKLDKSTLNIVDAWTIDSFMSTTDVGSLAIDDAGRAWVVNETGNKVAAFDISGGGGALNPLFQITSFAGGPGVFNHPLDITFAPDGSKVAVLDGGTNSLLVFGAAASPTPTPPPAACGDFITQFGATEFFASEGVTVVGSHIYVADINNARIARANLDGTGISTWISPGFFPQQLESDAAGNIYVTTRVGFQPWVYKFNSAGTQVAAFNVQAQSGEARGMAVSDDGLTIYVSNSGSKKVFKYVSVDGVNYSLATSWGSLGTGNGQFANQFWGIGIGQSGDVFVADGSNNRVQKFDANGNWLASWPTGSLTVGLTTDRSLGRVLFSTQDGFVHLTDESGNEITSWQHTFQAAIDLALDPVSGQLYGPQGGANAVRVTQNGSVCEPPPPPLSQCAITALQAMGLNPGDFPNLDSALDDACEAAVDDVTIIEAGNEPPNNYKMAPGEVVVLGEGAHISNNLIGDNNSSNALFLGNDVTIDGNSLKTEAVWVGGTGNLINGNVNHAVDVNVGPNAYLRVNGNINDLQNLNIGSGGTLSVGGNVDIYVSADIASGGLLEVDGTLDCNGAPTVNNNGTVTAGTNNCTLLAAASGGSGSGFAMYLPLLALAALGLAIYVKPRKAQA